MRTNVDLNSGKMIAGLGLAQAIDELRFKRSSSASIEVQFSRGGVVEELPVDGTGIFEVKAAGEYDSSPLTAGLAWIKTGTGSDTVYTFTIGLINDELDALLGIDPLAAFTAVAATNLITSAAHGLVATNIIRFSSTNTLPGGLAVNTNYYVIASGLTANDFKVSLTLGGSEVDITSTGTGVHSWRRIVTDIVSVTLMCELQWTTGGQKNKTQTMDFVLVNDVVRDGDVPPSMPAIVYAIFLPDITGLVGGGPHDLDALPTAGLITGYLIEVLVEVTGVLTWLTYILTAGPATDVDPGQVDPLDYDAIDNDRHWVGAVGPSGPAGVNAGIPYLWNTSTAATDPGSGKVKVNNASPALATALYISETDHEANALAALLATWDDGTSTIRGRILIQSPTAPANFIIYDVTGALVDNGTWDTFTVTAVASGGALTNNMPVQAFFVPRGDKGDIGITGSPGGIAYLWNTNTASSDPTAGHLKINNAALASATALYISETDNDTNALSAYLATLDDGTSTIRGRIFLTDPATPVNFAIYDISGAITDNGTWDTFTIAHVASGGAFTNNRPLRLIFVPKGDKGDTGSTGATGREAALQYLWNTSTANTDPTSGHLKVNNATLASATALYISETDNDTNALAALLATWDDGTSTIRGRVLIHSPASPTNFVLYDITGTLTDNGTWDTFTIAYVAGGGALTNDLPVTVVFIPKGDKGDAGSTDLIQNVQNAAYPIVLSDSGKHIFHDEVTARTYTIPANGAVAFPVGTTITIVNNNGAGAITLAITTDTLRRGDGTAGTGSRTIPADAIATILKTKTTEWMIAGVFT